MKSTTTSWVVTGLGAVVSGLGATMRQSRLGTGILGFGLAHMVLGILDMVRPLPEKYHFPKNKVACHSATLFFYLLFSDLSSF